MITGADMERNDSDRARLVVRLNMGINLLAGRDDLVASIDWDASPAKPPAWYNPATNEATLNGPVALAGADPADVNPLTPAGRRRHPLIVGLLCHEASHAHSTQWSDGFADHTPAPVVKAAVLLEEPRIEKRQLDRRPTDRIYLRASSRLVLLPEAASESATATRWRAAQAALLTAGRVDAGVLDKSEVRKVLTQCRATLGRRDFNALRALWREALRLDDGDVAGLASLAARWVEIVGADETDELPNPPCARRVPGAASDRPDDDDDVPQGAGRRGGAESGGPDDASGDDGSDGSDALSELFDAAMRGVADSGVAEAAADLLGDEDDGAHSPTATAAHRAQDTAAHDAAKEYAARVFHGYSPTGGTCPLGPTREPSTADRILARKLGAALRHAQFRERAKLIRPADLPPGRLIGREALLGAAQRSRSMPVTAKPFRQVIRAHTPHPPLTVGIAVDISGSMDWATDVMSTAAWAVAHAVSHVRGTSATVAFGEKITAVTKPGVLPARIQTFVANDGMEMFTDAIRALDGGLNLTRGDGVRVLFVVSDGHFVAPGERERADALVARLVHDGVVVLWVDLRGAAHSGVAATVVPDGAMSMPVTTADDIPDQMRAVLVRTLRAR